MKLRAKTKAETKTIEDLTKKEALLVQKVKDRDEELRGKARFIEVASFFHCWSGRPLTFSRMFKMR